MTESLRMRLSELTQREHLPKDHFAGADARAAAPGDRLMARLHTLQAETQSTLVSMSTQIAELEGKLDELRCAREQLLMRLPPAT